MLDLILHYVVTAASMDMVLHQYLYGLGGHGQQRWYKAGPVFRA